MARVQRRHKVGNRHHVGARGIAQRPVYERPSDFLKYLEIMREYLEAMCTRVRLISFCLMTNHLHLLLEGDVHSVSDFMMGLQQVYVQHFNRVRNRTGPLFKSRFWSRPVESLDDLMRTIRYIDQNPIQAGLVADPRRYAWGSAGEYIDEWNTVPLARDVLEKLLGPGICSSVDFSRAYSTAFGTPMSARDFDDLTVRHRRESARARRELESQDYCSPEYHEEMESMARFADGIGVLSRQVIPPSEIQARLARSPEQEELAQMPASQQGTLVTGAQLLEIALLKEACALTLAEIGARLGLSSSVACRRLRKHNDWLLEGGRYADLSESVLASVLGER